ncbi:hypothetical protein [Geobacter sp. DSM 9736]|uniref:InlB B-repeat-containing protein n=1 Tax=Geobacter sp. DSM 9736 TaxID=1277350 RepID=UPI000B509E90|nr:hypothetical protein [Geobacter sp. DSM 9736]SNB46773.1 delta-60 repeat domain-containing protein [Geobacter sp. DSM 9736]
MRKSVRLGGVLLLIQSLLISTAVAAPGALDTTFNSTGKSIYRGEAEVTDYGAGVALQADGKMVVVGYAHNGADHDILVTRYNSDGTLDDTFGNEGATTYDGGDEDYAYAVAFQADGKIVLTGTSNIAGDDRVIVLRYTDAGALDTTFGTEGSATYGEALWSMHGKALAIQPDGKILIAGDAGDPWGSNNFDVLLLRYNTDGTLDEGFAMSGAAIYDSFSSFDYGTAVSLLPDGKIVVAGHKMGATYDIFVVRFDTAGAFETSFVPYDGGPLVDDYSAAMVVDAAGKVVVAGYSHGPGVVDFVILRYDTDGTLDGGFGAGGARVYDSGGADYASAVRIQGDGKIVVSGSSNNGTNDDLVIARFNAIGAPDPGFGSAGIMTYNSGNNDYIFGLALQSDGKIVGAGSIQNGAASNQLVIRCTTGGVRDNAFDSDGIAVYDAAVPTIDSAYAVTTQPDGKTVVAGERMGDVLILRYTTEGVLDPEFGTDGIVTYDGGGTDKVLGIAIQQDGKIVVAGQKGLWPDHDLLLMRYNPDGTPDAGFGTAGVTSYDSGRDDTGYAVTVQPDGKIIVAGSATNFMGTITLLMRYNSDGTPDGTFGTGGVAPFDDPDIDLGNDYAGYALSLLPGGKILVTGSSSAKVLLLQVLGDGSLDPSFGTDGIVTIDRGESDFAMAAAVQTDGKIVVTGYTYNTITNQNDLLAMRFMPDGGLDATFGTGGIFTSDSSRGDWGNGMAFQPDGKIFLTGYKDNEGEIDLLLLRLDTDGSLDETFGASGLATYDIGGDDYGNALHVQNDGRIIVAGTSSGATDDIAVLRLIGGPYTLSVTKSAGTGTVTSGDGGISCGSDCSEPYELIGEVTLTAAAAAGFSFSSWSGCDTTSGNTCTVATSRQRQVSVAFEDIAAPELTVSSPTLGVSSGDITIAGTVSDNAGADGITVTVTINGQTYTPSVSEGGAFAQTVTLPVQKAYPFTVNATDQAANTTTVQRNVTYAVIPDLDGNSTVSVSDAIRALRYSLGLATPGPDEIGSFDFAPLVNGVPQPDGIIIVEDVFLILRQVVGLGW